MIFCYSQTTQNQCNQNPTTETNFLQTTTSSTSLAQQQQPQQQQQQHNNNLTGSLSVPITPATSTTPLGLGLGLSSNKMSRALYAHKLRTHTNKLKQHTNKIMSNFKGKLYCFLSQSLKITKKSHFDFTSRIFKGLHLRM